MTHNRSDIVTPGDTRWLLELVGSHAQRRSLKAYAVGGLVRDWLLGIQSSTDIDVTIEGSGVAVAKQVAREYGAPLIIHPQFGTSTLLFPEFSNMFTKGSSIKVMRLDIASCRKEVYSNPAAYPKVASGNLRDDLARRDFTVNAMAVSINPRSFGRLIDFYHGVEDLKKRKLRILHNESFIDDPSRILRGIRFFARFGFQWEKKTEHLLIKAVGQGALSWLNSGRLSRELDYMCTEPNPSACFRNLLELMTQNHKNN